MKLTLIYKGEMQAPVRFGLEQLEAAAKRKNIKIERDTYWNGPGPFLLVGNVQERFLQIALKRAGIEPERKPEGVVLANGTTDDGRSLGIVSGTDSVGLMYALCELAQRIEADGKAALENIGKTVEYPAIAHRIVGRFLHSERDDSWYFSDEFWDMYTARLAMNRINRLHLITGMDTAYMSPPYPFLIETPGYEEVTAVVKGDAKERRNACLNRLRKIGALCHERGIAFCFGCWQHKPWTENQKSLVHNCPEGDRFAEYAQSSIRELIDQCPEIDILSFRVNPEAGVRDASGTFHTAQEFWYGMFRAIRSAGRRVKVELRAKGLTDTMIEYALSLGLDLTVPTKAWCEHVGLPYQMLQMRQEEMKDGGANENDTRRYSYDNLQRSPRSYDLQYRLWNYGSTNILLWGDPYYVSKFVKSCIEGQATGFEFTAPLSMKGGHAMIPGEEWPIHVHPDMITYRFEDERYWMWYLSFGRMSYSPDASPELWRRELRLRFGDAAWDMEQAYIYSSRILPLITTAHFPEHPSMHYWPELYGSAALFAEHNYEPWFRKEKSPRRKDSCYGNADPSDEALFTSIEAYVEGMLKGQPVHCYSPLEVGDWYYALAKRTMDSVSRLEGMLENPEIRASVVDFTMLANLGFYHSYMVQAAYFLCLYDKTERIQDLQSSYKAMYLARGAFAKVSELGSKYYARNLEFDTGDSTRRNGNWQDRLEQQVDADLKKLEGMMEQKGIALELPQEGEYRSLVKPYSWPIRLTDDVPDSWTPGQPLKVTLSVGLRAIDCAGIKPMLHYRNVNMREGKFRVLPMKAEGDVYTAVIPGEYITGTYNLYIYFTCEDLSGNIRVHPGIWNPEQAMPVYTVKTNHDF